MFWNQNPSHHRERFTLEELSRLYSILLKHTVVTEANSQTLVETLRSIAELMIWGDQHEPRFFEFFLENQVLVQFHRILSQPGARRGDVAQQVLQTLSIMIQNIRNQTSIYFLFSNNQINSMLSLKLDFDDEEVMGYYISFLKAIALKFNAETVQLFLNIDNTDPAVPKSFPLYTEALKFFRHKESMVRAGVRTLTLSVYSIRDDLVRNFVLAKPACDYFRHLAMYLSEQCQLLDTTLLAAESNSSNFSADMLDNVLAEVEDVLVYCNDVLCTACDEVSHELARRMWSDFLVPCCFVPLAKETDSIDKGTNDSSWVDGYHAVVRPVCALYVSERVFALMSHRRLVSSFACALLGADSTDTDAFTGMKPPELGKLKQGAVNMVYRSAILSALKRTDCQLAGAVVRLLFAVLQHTDLSMELLDRVGLLPYRKRKRRDLLNSLTEDEKKGKDAVEADGEETITSPGITVAKGRKKSDVHSKASLEVLDVLFELLKLHALPASILWCTGWLLGQLVPLTRVHGNADAHVSRVLTQEQHSVLAKALQLCRDDAMDEVAGLWCDALPTLVSAEWAAARRGIRAPAIKSHSEAVLGWLTASDAQSKKLAGMNSRSMYTQPQAQGQMSMSARAAAQTAVTIQRLVAVVQIRMLLDKGDIPETSPLPRAAEVAAVVRRSELREGDVVELSSSGSNSNAMPCRVAFSRGVERSVYFSMQGVTVEEESVSNGALLKSTPVLVLADPASARFNGGTVLSTAPLLGADPAVDGSHPHWLHVHVRPPIRGLVKALKLGAGNHGLGELAAPGGATLLGVRYLQDGHWVLSFPEADAAAHAKAVVEEQASKMRALFCQFLGELLWDDAQGEATVNAEMQQKLNLPVT